jgi:hypothetical protein
VLLALALCAVLPRLAGPVQCSVDGLFYQAQVYELQGESQNAALRRAFSSQAAIRVAREPGQASRVENSAWVKYSAPFYRRRWLVPAIAAALYPIAGDRSLLYASMLGYVAVGLLLFALLRTRFSDGVGLLAAAACLCLPPLIKSGSMPATDSWGLALEVAALLAALLALERGGRWIAVWVATILALSFTRDATVVLLVAVGAIAIATRTRRSAAVLAMGIAASIPEVALFGAPLEKQLTYILQGFRIPTAVNWSYVVAHYPAAAWSVIWDDAAYPNWNDPVVEYPAAAALVAAVAYMLVSAPRRDVFFTLNRAAIVGAVVTVALAVNYTGLRLELVFVPCVAVGLAFAVQRLLHGAPPAPRPGILRLGTRVPLSTR